MTLSLSPLAVEPSWHTEADVVIVGTGAAGLSAALASSGAGRRVLVLAKGELSSGSTPLAQGGLAVVTDAGDSFSQHASDTLAAAAGLADRARVEDLVSSAPKAVQVLRELGAHFDEGALGLEGGHSQRRIVHAGGDAIGAELHRVLRAAVAKAPVEIAEHTAAIDLVLDEEGKVAGLTVGRVEPDGSLAVGLIATTAVVLATGGYGQCFASSTNPADVTGDGLALAARAGAEIMNVEFVQFHPTVLFTSEQRGRSPLITEALRGAGATIIDDDGRLVMRGTHPSGDLAPRDVVAYAMVERMAALGSTHLWLDARGLGAARLEEGFPTTVSLCRAYGVEPAREPIPIAPGAHYACGGVRADLSGETSIPGLFAVGEVAATGVHGANRLASNSLTEALISGRRTGEHLARSPRHASEARTVRASRAAGVDAMSRDALALEMSAHASVVRDRAGLEHLLATLEATPTSVAPSIDLATLEATNLHAASLMVVSAALWREESRGCHRRSDFADTDPAQAEPRTLRVVEGILVNASAMAGA